MNKDFPNLTDDEVRKLNIIEGGSGSKKVLADLMNRAIGGAETVEAALPSGQEADPTLLSFESAASVGGAATEAMTFTGLLATDEITGINIKTQGANTAQILEYNTQVADGLTVVFNADPGAGAIVEISVKRA